MTVTTKIGWGVQTTSSTYTLKELAVAQKIAILHVLSSPTPGTDESSTNSDEKTGHRVVAADQCVFPIPFAEPVMQAKQCLSIVDSTDGFRLAAR